MKSIPASLKRHQPADLIALAGRVCEGAATVAATCEQQGDLFWHQRLYDQAERWSSIAFLASKSYAGGSNG